MKAFMILAAGFALANSVQAQSQEEPIHGRAFSESDSAEVVPGAPDSERPSQVEFQTPEFDDAVPVPMPGFSKPHPGPTRAILHEVATGLDTLSDLPVGFLKVEEFLQGRNPLEEEFEPESFGSLGPVTSQAFPYSTMCRIFFSQGGINYVASGTLIDARTVITAGHCVHQGSGGAWSQNVRVRPAWDGDANAFGESSATSLATFTSWTVSGSLDGDMGFIRLDRPVGFLTGWLGTFYNTSGSFWSSTGFRVSGYPATCFSGAPNRLYTSQGLWDGIMTNRVEAVLSSSCPAGGMSGGGAYYIDGSGNRYCGANWSYSFGGSQVTRMGCNRMTQSKFDYCVGSFMPGGYSSTVKDLVPLRTRTGNTTIRRGQAPTSMNYKVYNASNFNPGSASTNVSVYLSTNSDIASTDTRIQTHSFTWNFGVKTGVTINMTPPVIPPSTAPGTYFLGILITSSDANNGNNDTSAWDAQRITVTL